MYVRGRLAIAAVICGVATAAAAAEDRGKGRMPVALDEMPQVILPGSPGEVTQFAAEELSRYLGQMIGRPPEIVHEPSADPRRGQIHVGWTSAAREHAADAADQPEDGFVLRAIPGSEPGAGYRFYIVGSNPRGTLYGVYALLEDHLGCRWFEPGEDGQFVPKLDTIDLSSIDRKDAPSLEHRCLRIRHVYEGDALYDYIDWQAKQRMNVLYWHGAYIEYIDRHKTMAPFHADDGRLLWFVRKRGFIIDNSSHAFKRFFRDGPVDMGSKAFEDVAVAELSEFLDRNPFIDLLGLWLGDGGRGFTKVDAASCPLDYPDTRVTTQELDWRSTSPKVSITNTYVDFVNRVQNRIQQKYPDVSLTLIAYNRSLLAPNKVKCAPGQQVHIAFRRSYSYGFGDPESKWNSRQAIELNHWLAVCPHVVLYDYYQTGNLGSVGRPFPRTIAADLKYLDEVGAAGTASQSRSDLFRSLGPNYYTYAKCSWDTGADVEAVLADYYRAAYGPAAGPVMELFDLWEATYNRGGDYFRYDWNAIVPLFPPRVRQEMLSLAGEARRKAADASAEQRRRTDELALVIEGFDAFMRFAQTGDAAARQKALDLSQAYPFVRATVESLSKGR